MKNISFLSSAPLFFPRAKYFILPKNFLKLKILGHFNLKKKKKKKKKNLIKKLKISS